MTLNQQLKEIRYKAIDKVIDKVINKEKKKAIDKVIKKAVKKQKKLIISTFEKQKQKLFTQLNKLILNTLAEPIYKNRLKHVDTIIPRAGIEDLEDIDSPMAWVGCRIYFNNDIAAKIMIRIEISEDINIFDGGFRISNRHTVKELMGDSPSFVVDFLQVLKEIETKQNR